MPTKPNVILAQVFISGLMALLMSGIMSALHAGFPPGWVAGWLATFFTAWPIAFVLSLGVSPLAFRLAAGMSRQSR